MSSRRREGRLLVEEVLGGGKDLEKGVGHMHETQQIKKAFGS